MHCWAVSTRVIIRVKASIMPGIFVKNMIKHVLTLFKTHFWCDEICFMTRLENDEVKRRWHVMPWAKQHDMVTLTRKKVWQRPAQLWWFELFSWCTISLKKDKKNRKRTKKGRIASAAVRVAAKIFVFVFSRNYQFRVSRNFNKTQNQNFCEIFAKFEGNFAKCEILDKYN